MGIFFVGFFFLVGFGGFFLFIFCLFFCFDLFFCSVLFCGVFLWGEFVLFCSTSISFSSPLGSYYIFYTVM